VLHIATGLFSLWFFSGGSFNVVGLLIFIPIITIGLLYYFGEVEKKKLAWRLIVFIPLIIILVISIPQGIRVSYRINDGDFSMRMVEGYGVMAWAPRGPGWPDRGTSWHEAVRICKHLSEDGMILMEEEQNIWRLPTVIEAVSSMMLHGENAGGVWYQEVEKASYRLTPDKETPLWDVNSKVIYYWTADTVPDSEEQAYMIVYDGNVYKRDKESHPDYLSFRAVKEVK